MKVEEAPDGALIVTYDGSALTKVMLAVAALFASVAGYDAFIGGRGPERMIGLLASAATCASIGLVFLETARFDFARATGRITWRRRWALRRRAGSMPFSDVQSVQVERPIGDDGTPSRRIVLRTTEGAGIPLTAGYQPDPDRTVLDIASRIRVLLGLEPEVTQSPSVDGLVASGQIIEAIRVLREEEGLSLTDAKQRVDELKRRPE